MRFASSFNAMSETRRWGEGHITQTVRNGTPALVLARKLWKGFHVIVRKWSCHGGQESHTCLSQDAVVVYPSPAAAGPSPYHYGTDPISAVQPSIPGVVHDCIDVAVMYHLHFRTCWRARRRTRE